MSKRAWNEALKKARIERGFTQGDAAAFFGKSRRMWCYYESGKIKPGPYMLAHYMERLSRNPTV